MIEVLISSLFVTLVSHRVALLRASSLNRLLAIPLLVMIVCFLVNKAINLNKLDIELYFFSGYVLYQIINLANTSRRCITFLNLGKPIDIQQSTKQRIEAMESGQILVFRDGKYEVQRSGLYFFYLGISYLVLSFDSGPRKS